MRVTEPRSRDELYELATTFNLMLQRLESSFELQKSFISNASHELRTPLAAAISEMQVLLARDRDPGEYISAISSLLEDLNKIKELINSLLELIHVDSIIGGSGVDLVRLDEILWDVRDEILQSEPASKISVEIMNMPDDQAGLTIPGNANLIRVAFSNIINNACKFSGFGEVLCKLTCDTINKEVILSVSDNGIGISETDLEKIFSLFFRSENAIGFAGHGIGLALTEKIITMHKGIIKVVSVPGHGTTFTITLRQ